MQISWPTPGPGNQELGVGTAIRMLSSTLGESRGRGKMLLQFLQVLVSWSQTDLSLNLSPAP